MAPAGSAEKRARRQNEPDATVARVEIGRITGAHGLAGALRVRTSDPDSQTLNAVARVFVRDGATEREYKLRDITRLNRTTTRVTLDGVDDPDVAQAMRGAIVLVAQSDLPAINPGEFYYFQAVGCEVITTAGRRIGLVEEVFSNGANDILVVRDEGAEVLVPVIEDVVKAMDLDRRVVIVEAVRGLLD